MYQKRNRRKILNLSAIEQHQLPFFYISGIIGPCKIKKTVLEFPKKPNTVPFDCQPLSLLIGAEH